MRLSRTIAICSIAFSGCAPTYTPLSYNTTDIEPLVACAKYVLPADVELLRRAGGWQIGTLSTIRASPQAARIVAQHGGTHFYVDGRTLMAVHIAEEKIASLPAPLRPATEKFPHGCTEESYR